MTYGSEFIREADYQAINLYRRYGPVANEFDPTGVHIRLDDNVRLQPRPNH